MYMQRALDLAAQGEGFAQPNPLVGAVLVHEDRILAEGYHHRAGEAHAEIMALRNLRDEDRHLLPFATLYVSLEPCSHQGRTGPCSLALVEQGVGRVVVATTDPNPLVSGRGLAQLRAGGCDVTVGLLQTKAEWLNRSFFWSFREGRPWVVLKWAVDRGNRMDGPRTPEHSGPWAVTGIEAQIWSHRLRQRCGALLIGAGTWTSDYPNGRVRAWAGPEITRVIWAERPLHPADRNRAHSEGWQIWCPEPGESENTAMLRCLNESNQRSLMVEGGAKLHNRLLRQGLWNEAYQWVSPIELPLGGPTGPEGLTSWTSVGRFGLDELRYTRNVKPKMLNAFRIIAFAVGLLVSHAVWAQSMIWPPHSDVVWKPYAHRSTPWMHYERHQAFVNDQLIEGAEGVVSRALDGTIKRVRWPELPEHPAGAHFANGDSNAVWLIRDAHWVPARRWDVHRAHPLRRVRFWLDAQGRILDSLDLIRRADSLISSKVFAPDPLTKVNAAYGGIYVDGNDGNQGVLDSLRHNVLIRTTWNGSGFLLANSAAIIQEFDPPVNSVPVLTSQVADFSRSAPEFEMVNALFHLHAWKQRISTLGYGSMVPYAIPVDVNAYGGADQSAFDYGTTPPRLYFGEGGVDDAEDPDVLIHEYGHAMCYGAAPGTNISTQRQALEEALCDYFAVAWSLEWSPNRWADVFTWDGHNNFWAGRSAVNTQQNMYPGLVFTGPYSHTSVMVDALMRGRQRLGGTVMDGLVMEALHQLQPSTTFTQFAEDVLFSDTVKYAGSHAEGLRIDFGTWHILTPGLGTRESPVESESGVITLRPGFWPEVLNSPCLLMDASGRITRVERGGILPAAGWYCTSDHRRVVITP